MGFLPVGVWNTIVTQKSMVLIPIPRGYGWPALAMGDRGAVTVGWAPEMPAVSRPADVVLLLDMLHYLDDETVAAVFKRSFQALGDKGLLVTRFALLPTGRPSWSWRLGG